MEVILFCIKENNGMVNRNFGLYHLHGSKKDYGV
jgi:hypothetical protein